MANALNNSSFTGGCFTPARGKTVQKICEVSGVKGITPIKKKSVYYSPESKTF